MRFTRIFGREDEQELEPMATPALGDPTHVHLSEAS